MNLNEIGMSAELVDVDNIKAVFPSLLNDVLLSFSEILDIRDGKYKNVSPCTPCHNAKMLVLCKWAESNGISSVATGHHTTDAIASLLKSYYMYQDRWVYNNNYSFETNRFLELVKQQKYLFKPNNRSLFKTELYTKIEEQISKKNVGTDEGIIQDIKGLSAKICRPLYNVREYEIIDYYKPAPFVFDKAECFLTNIRTDAFLTPREIVHQYLLNNEEEIFESLLELCYLCMNDEGQLLFRARNNRHNILGQTYKSDKININKL